MDVEAKKTALRMIPYGLSVLTARDESGNFAAASLNLVTQASFQPPQIVVCLKRGSTTLDVVESAGRFALNLLAKDQGPLAFAFFKHVEAREDKLGGVGFHFEQGIPVLDPVPAFILCQMKEMMGEGDHVVVLAEVLDAGVTIEVPGRPDDLTLKLGDMEGNIFYGG